MRTPTGDSHGVRRVGGSGGACLCSPTTSRNDIQEHGQPTGQSRRSAFQLLPCHVAVTVDDQHLLLAALNQKVDGV